MSERGEQPRVAVVRLDALGDTLLSTPAIEVLCREVGAENVLVITSQGLGLIFGDSPAHYEADKTESEQSLAKIIDDFGAQTVYVFSEKRRALRAAYLSQAKERIGFDPGWTQPLRSFEVRRYLTVRFPIVNSLDSSSRYHEVERYCRLVAKGLFKKSVNGGRLKFFTVERSEDVPVEAVCDDRPCGFQWASKWLNDDWPKDLLLRLVEQMPPDTLIFVAPQELEDARSALPQERAENLVCCQRLTEYAQNVARCRYLVTIDTGAVHVASAMGVPVVDVFPQEGSHHTVPRWRPWMTPHRVVLKPVYSGAASMESLINQVRESTMDLVKILNESLCHKA